MARLWAAIKLLFREDDDTTPIPPVTAGLSPEQRGTYARQLLGNPLLDEIFKSLLAEAHALWANTHIGDMESREHLFKHHRVLNTVQSRIARCIADAVLNEHAEEKRRSIP